MSGLLRDPPESERGTRTTRQRAIQPGLLGVLAYLCVALGCAGLSPERIDSPARVADAPARVADAPESVEFVGTIDEDEDLSAVAALGRFLLIGSDETRQIQVLERHSESEYHVVGDPVELLPSGGEIDIEAITTDGHRVYVAGSHSLTRKKTKKSKTLRENRSRISTVAHEPNRDRLFALDFDIESGEVRSIESKNLREILESDDILARFTTIPGKENGIDIEGMAARGDRLYLGFRSPVLRQNPVPVLLTTFSTPADYELLFVDLKGMGIRDMVSIPGGLILLAGPPGSAEGSFALYAWDGRDALVGSGNPGPRLLREIVPPVGGAKPEGMALLESRGACHRLLLVYDGVSGGSPQSLEVCMD